MGAKLGGDDDAPIVDINVTPLVDIVLVLLIIFMVTATYIVKPSIKVNLPEAATGEATESTSLGLTLTGNGALLLDGEAIDADGVRTRIQEARAARLKEEQEKEEAERNKSKGDKFKNYHIEPNNELIVVIEPRPESFPVTEFKKAVGTFIDPLKSKTEHGENWEMLKAERTRLELFRKTKGRL